MEDEKKFRAIFEYAPLAIMYTDEKGVITSCNQSAIRLFGAPKEKLIGFSYTQIRDEAMKDAIGNALSGKTSHFEGEYLTVTGGVLTHMNANFSPSFSAEGTISGVIGIFEDLNGRISFEKRKERLVNEIRNRPDESKCLTGIHTICAACKKIRDARGNWSQIEAYFREWFNTEFTHTICPECLNRLYPDLRVDKSSDMT